MPAPQQLGPYVLLDEIGAGGMGTVYLGRHQATGQVVAVKVLPAALAREEGFVLRFDREIEALRRVENPYIVRLYDSGTVDGTPFYAMEYVDGETLAQRVTRERRLPWRTVVAWGIELCAALKAAHDAGIVHRDLKPSNILITRDDHIKLTDFGVAQVFASDRLTATGGVIGTAEYMSPEQAQGQRATKRSDLYSLGAVMYVMLTGRPPFTGPSAVDILQRQKFGQFDPPQAYVPDLPVWLNDLVLQLLEKSPDDRPPDAYVLSRRLQEVLAKVNLRESERLPVRSGTPTETADPLAPLDGPPTIASQLSRSEDAVGPAGIPVGKAAAAASAQRRRAPGAGTLMRNLVKQELQAEQDGSWWSGWLDHPLVLITVLAALIGFVLWMQPRAPSDAERFAQAEAWLREPAGTNWSRARTEILEPLVRDNAAQWEAQAQPLLDKIAAHELEAELLPPRRRSLKRTASTTEWDRQLREVRRAWDAGNFDAAQQRLKALLALAEVADATTIPPALKELLRKWEADLEAERTLPPEGLDDVRRVVQQLLTRPASDPLAQAAADGLQALYGGDPRFAETLAPVHRWQQQPAAETVAPSRDKSPP